MSRKRKRTSDSLSLSENISYDIEDDVKVVIKKKFKPRTRNQNDYIRDIVENQITICTGPAGSGKTFCSTAMALGYLSRGDVSRLIFSRPIVNCGKGLGFLPGGLDEKIEKYFYPILDCLEFFLGIEQTKYLRGMGIIKFEPLETMRGSSIKDTFLVLDETSNCEYAQLKMILSRIDYGSKFVLQGDPEQCDLTYCHLKDVIRKLQNSKITGLAISHLDSSDIQRPQIVSDLMAILE